MRGERNTIEVAAMIAALALSGVLAAGCSMSRWAEVEPGEYVALHASPATHDLDARSIEKLAIDRDQHLMALTLVDGTQILTSFVPRDRADWPSGCPSNVNSTRMEVLEIAEDPLTVGSSTFSHPILVRDCPPDPPRLVLRGDGTIGGGGSACPHPEPCITFGRQSTASPNPISFPHSPKGYELYSWKSGEEWYFTLITGTNRLKRYQEIVSTDSVVMGTEWVKFTVKGTENLESLLGQLPEGETVTWIGDRWLERAGATVGEIRLPGPQVMREIESHCHRLDLQLQVAD